MPELSHIAAHPIKALDPVDRDEVAVTEVGGLAGDRAFAIVDDEGYVNGKRTAAVNRIRADIDLDRRTVVLAADSAPEEFHLDRGRNALERWLSDHLGTTVRLEERVGGKQTDSAVYGDGSKTGPTVVSEATLETLASWYDSIDVEGMRLRLRPNLVISGVEPFWEERLIGGGCHLRIGDIRLESVGPVSRCVVPTRDPHTGEATEDFRKRFIEGRQATLPDWTTAEALEGNLYSATVATRIPETDRGGTLAVGDDVELVEGGLEAGE